MNFQKLSHAIGMLLLSGGVEAIGQVQPFPPIGGSSSQAVHIHLVALGTNATACGAKLGFRLARTGEPVGPSETANLRLGETKTISLRLDSLGIGPGGREEVQPIVELTDASCFASVEVTDRAGRESAAYVSGSSLAPNRPAGATDSPFVEARPKDSVRLDVMRTWSGSVDSACDIHLGFHDQSGRLLGPEAEASLAPGEARGLTVKLEDFQPFPDGPVRVLLDIHPTRDGGAAGCAAAAQVYENASGDTVRYFPIAIPNVTSALAIPPPPQPRTDPPPLPAIGGPVPIGHPVTIRSPLGLPAVVFPADNPPTEETIALGRRLFYDKRLSVDGSVACASCHDPAAAFSDPRRLSLGVNGSDGERHSMSVVNAALSQEVFWEGRANGLEAQAREPVRGTLELAHSLEGAERRLQADPSYVKQFEAAFGPGPIVYDMAAKAIATFQRTLLSGNSPFDRFSFKGDRNAMSASAQRGLNQFRLANCVTCHQIEGPYATFGNTRFFNTGVAATSFTTLSDQGRWKVTGNEIDRGAFRPPSLRNVALRAPYMHDGSLKSLEEVIQFYVVGGRANLWRSPELVPAPRGAAAPTAQDLQDLLEFLRSLTGDMPENAGPPEEPATGNPPTPGNGSGPVSVTSINAVGGGPDVAQNTWIEIKGTNLAPADLGAGGFTWSTAPEFASGKMPTQLRGVSVKVNGKPAYVYYISPTQVNVLTPLDGTQGSVPVQLTNGASTSAPLTVTSKERRAGIPAFGSNQVHRRDPRRWRPPGSHIDVRARLRVYSGKAQRDDYSLRQWVRPTVGNAH